MDALTRKYQLIDEEKKIETANFAALQKIILKESIRDLENHLVVKCLQNPNRKQHKF